MLSEQVRLAGGCGVVVHKQIIALLWPRFQRHQQKCPPARTATAWRPVGRTRSLLWGRLWAGVAPWAVLFESAGTRLLGRGEELTKCAGHPVPAGAFVTATPALASAPS